MSKNINYEKDYLVIHTDENKKFKRFKWYSAELATIDDITNKINSWNTDQQIRTGGGGELMQLVTDPLIRDICAYSEEQDRAISDLDNTEEIKEKINDAIYELKDVVRKLESIRI